MPPGIAGSSGQALVEFAMTIAVFLVLVLGAVTVGSIGLFLLAWRTFFRLSGDFAEDL